MGLDDLYNTSLVLGLGFSSSSTVETTKSNNKVKINSKSELPSLTLSLSGEIYDSTVKKVEFSDNNIKGQYLDNLYRQDSGASSFVSNVSSVKREREMGSEEVVLSSRNLINSTTDEDDDGLINGRKKLRLTKVQSALLEESFKIHSTLNPKQKQELARELKLRPRQVEVWFQNRRARTKLKQTEVDCEFLKKCCESLTDENRRLQKELQELKALKLAQPLYMQLPAATLTMCPSCERIGGGGGAENAAKSNFTMAPKPHFYNPFTNPSAAC
ncbi:hypothetical protein RD792_016648 [Penstemon davidsonii]|uniref:Homeobox domain-containing protein n=1 Tax=Penstemon davidsonii TaxID=160366 RepID=A0ABR0CKD9_9LAMI|nr:hypothetical protein RD792_016648 [Penstemon davidsonii]